MADVKNVVDMSKMGVFVTGIVGEKNVYPSPKGDRHSIDLMIPGSEKSLSVSIPAALAAEVVKGQVISLSVGLRVFNGRLYSDAK